MHRFLLGSTLILGLLAAGPAAAQLAATHIEEGQLVYFGGKVEWAKVNLPRTLNFLGLNPGGSNSFDGENQVTGWGAGGGIGFVLPPSKVDLGRNLRIEVSGGTFRGEAESRFGFDTGDVFWVSQPDGSTAGISTLTEPTTLDRTLDYRTWNVDLLVRTDFGDSEGIVLSPFFGTTYTRENRREQVDFGFRFTPQASAINQDLDTDYAGLALGGSLLVPLGPARLSLTGRGDVMGANTEVTARTSIRSTQGHANDVRAKDDDFAFSARLGGSAGISIPLGPLRIAAEGFGSWLSWAPQVAWAGPLTAPGPIRLTSDTLWTWGGRGWVELVF